jgi:hypothetical protein
MPRAGTVVVRCLHRERANMPTLLGAKDDRRPVSVIHDRSVTIASRAWVLLGALALAACSSSGPLTPPETSADAGDAATAEPDADRRAGDAATAEGGAPDRPAGEVAFDGPVGELSTRVEVSGVLEGGAFYPCGGTEAWWFDGGLIIVDGFGADAGWSTPGRALLKVAGLLSAPGAYGPRGAYKRRFILEKVLEARPAAETDCKACRADLVCTASPPPADARGCSEIAAEWDALVDNIDRRCAGDSDCEVVGARNPGCGPEGIAQSCGAPVNKTAFTGSAGPALYSEYLSMGCRRGAYDCGLWIPKCTNGRCTSALVRGCLDQPDAARD